MGRLSPSAVGFHTSRSRLTRSAREGLNHRLERVNPARTSRHDRHDRNRIGRLAAPFGLKPVVTVYGTYLYRKVVTHKYRMVSKVREWVVTFKLFKSLVLLVKEKMSLLRRLLCKLKLWG